MSVCVYAYAHLCVCLHELVPIAPSKFVSIFLYQSLVREDSTL